MTNRRKLLSESKCNKTRNEGHYKTSRNQYRNRVEGYKNIQTLNYKYIQHLEIIFGIYLTVSYT